MSSTAATSYGVPRRWGDSTRLVFDVGAVAFDSTQESDQLISMRLKWPAPVPIFFFAERLTPVVGGDALTISGLISAGVGSAAVRDMPVDLSALGPIFVPFMPCDSLVVAARVRLVNPAPAAHQVVVRVTASAAPWTNIQRGDVL